MVRLQLLAKLPCPHAATLCLTHIATKTQSNAARSCAGGDVWNQCWLQQPNGACTPPGAATHEPATTLQTQAARRDLDIAADHTTHSNRASTARRAPGTPERPCCIPHQRTAPNHTLHEQISVFGYTAACTCHPGAATRTHAYAHAVAQPQNCPETLAKGEATAHAAASQGTATRQPHTTACKRNKPHTQRRFREQQVQTPPHAAHGHPRAQRFQRPATPW
jgi:hypothetical protein